MLIVHGSPASQPSRSVIQVLLARGLPFRLEVLSRDLGALNPRRQMPTVVDQGFVLYEMNAILPYLCRKHGWDDLLPEALEQRAVLDQYLHFHHTMTRLATYKLMAPHVTPIVREHLEASDDVILRETVLPMLDRDDKLVLGRRIVARLCELIEQAFFGREDGPSDYLCSTDAPTVADYAAYEELAQLAWAGLFDFAPYPRIAPWLERMSGAPGHDAVHAYNRALGDLAAAPITLERFAAANLQGIAALQGVGVDVVAPEGVVIPGGDA